MSERTTDTKNLLVESLNLPQLVPWHNKEAKVKLETDLRDAGLVAMVNNDGSYDLTPLAEFIPESVFTTKWNAAPAEMPNGETYEDAFPIDFGLVPNPKDRIDLKECTVMPGVKYAVEGETAIMAEVTEDGFKLIAVGEYQDLSDRDVSPAGKTWGTGKVAGVSPLWIKIDKWEDMADAVVNAKIEGIRKDDSDGDRPRTVSIPAVIDRESRHWGKDFEEKLRAHEVFKDLHLPVGTKIVWTTSLLYWEQTYDVRYYHTDETPTLNMSSTLTFLDGREIESIVVAHTIEAPNPQLDASQSKAKELWQKHAAPQMPTRTLQVDSATQEAFQKARSMQQTKGKLVNLVTDRAFQTGANPDMEDMKGILPEYEMLRKRYEEARRRMAEVGTRIDLTLVKSGDSLLKRNGLLGGVVVRDDGQALDDTIAKRSVQRAYDVGGAIFWQKSIPDMVIVSERTSPLATMEVALKTGGETFPEEEIVRDWRLNERSFGVGTGSPAANYEKSELHSFTNSIEGGENFSFVHLKSIDFLVNLMEAANDFCATEHRPLRVVVSAEEGPTQILKAVLDGAETKEGVFDPIESTATFNFNLSEAFSWPKFTDAREICVGTDRAECDGVILASTMDVSSNTIGTAATEMIARLLRQEGHLGEAQSREIDMAIEDLANKGDQLHMVRMRQALEDIVKAAGANRFMAATQRIIDRLLGDAIDQDVKSHEGDTLIEVLNIFKGFATQYA